MKYTLDDLFVLGRRSGNKKRTYLLIDPLQAKHIPVSPSKAMAGSFRPVCFLFAPILK